MKNHSKKFLSFILCLLLVLANISEMAITAFAEPISPTVSENNTDIADTPANTDDPGKADEPSNAETQDPTATQKDENLPDHNTTSDLPESNIDDTENTLEADSALPVGTTFQASFYDSDGTTLLFQIPFVIYDDSRVLSTQLSDPSILTPVKNGYALKKWLCITRNASYSPTYIYNSMNFNKDYTFVAIWNTSPFNYSIQYNLDGGKFKDPDSSDHEDVPATSFNVENDKDIVLQKPVRKGYLFDGWYKDASYTEPISVIPAHYYIDFNLNLDSSEYQFDLFAKWTPVEIGKTSITSLTNPSAGKVTITVAEALNTQGYEVEYSTDSNFKKNVHTKKLENRTTFSLSNLPNGKTYSFRVRAYKNDSTDKPFYSDYSEPLSIKINKGVKEYTAKSNSGKLNSVTIVNNTDLCVKATVSQRLKSSDDFYYLVTVDPVSGKVLKKIDQTDKIKKPVFQVPVRDENGNNYVQGKFAIAVKKGSKYMLISKAAFIKNPEDAALYTAAFPKTTSKKGLQGSMDTSLGVQHTFINMDLNDFLNGSTPFMYNGKKYYFNDAYGSAISSANSSNMTISGQIMMTWSDSKKYMILKSARNKGHVYYALNAQEKKAREELEAVFAFMAERYSTPDCHLDNWILGNEVNIHQAWYYAGNISYDSFMKNYADTYRILYYAVRSNSKNSRIFICTDHTWINRCGDWGARPFMDSFNKEIKAQNKNIQWNLAYHAYPSILTSAATWRDSHVSNDNGSEFVTPRNLNVLTNYVKKNFGSKTHILLSEQGFTSNSGQDVQAAALAYTYYKAQFNDMIDAVIFRSYEDASVEVQQGLSFGLLTDTGKKKKAYNVYKYMDTPDYAKYTKNCLSTIGQSSWDDIVPGFSDKKLKKMPKR